MSGKSHRIEVGWEGDLIKAKDVCSILGFNNPSDATKYLDEDERSLISNPSGNGVVFDGKTGFHHSILSNLVAGKLHHVEIGWEGVYNKFVKKQIQKFCYGKNSAKKNQVHGRRVI